MVTVDRTVLGDPGRLAAVDSSLRLMAALPDLADTIARVAACALAAPMAMVVLVGDDRQDITGSYRLRFVPTEGEQTTTALWAGDYVVSANRSLRSTDVLADEDLRLGQHPLMTRNGVRSFLTVPIRDLAGRPVGCLAVFDVETRRWSDDQVGLLGEIAGLLHRDVAAVAPPSVGGLDEVSLLDSVQEAFLSVDRDGVVRHWNRAAQEMLGYRAADVCGVHLDDSLLPDYDGQPIGAALARLFSAAPRRQVARTVNLRHRDGHRLAARASLSVVPAAVGPLACVFLTDLTGQIAAENAADRSDRFLAALLDSLSVGVIACDAAGKVMLINRALREVQPVPVSAAVLDDYAATAETAMVHADMSPMSWQQTPLMRAVHGERVDASDVLIQAPGHRLRTFSTTARPIIGSTGRRLGAVAVAHEVTALRRAEKFRGCHLEVEQVLTAAELPQQAAPGVLRAVAGALGWPHAELWLIDETTDSLHPIGHWSSPEFDADEVVDPKVIKGVGVIGQVWSTGTSMWVPDIAEVGEWETPDARASLEACRRLGVRTVLAVPVRDGNTLLGVLSCFAGAPEPHEDLLTVLLDGVAAQFGVFVALRRAAALAHQLDRAKDDFIALVGHEMRTPLTSIAANTAMLSEDAQAFSDDHRHMVQAVERNTAVLQNIVDMLLDLAALDAGYTALADVELNLAEIVAQAVAAAQSAGTASDVRFQTDLPERTIMTGDPKRMRQALDDLLSNAVKYSPRGAGIVVRLGSDGDIAELTIADAGIGIPDHERDHVFDRFYRGSNVRHHGTAGHGLGLSRARTIVGLHGGSITLIDRQPVGTTVQLRLPLHQRSPQANRYA